MRLYDSGLFVSSNVRYAGLFSQVGTNAKIKNLTLRDSYIEGTATTGEQTLAGICADAGNARIENCTNAATISGGKFGSYLGGIVGEAAQTTVVSCTMEGLYSVKNCQELVVIGSTISTVEQGQGTTAPHATFRSSVLKGGLNNYYTGSGEAMFSGCSGLLTATVDCAYIGPFMFGCRNIQKITFTNPDVRFYYLGNNESGHPINVSGPAVTLVGHTCSQVQKLVNQTYYERTLRFEAIENDQGTHGQHVVIPAEKPTCTKAGRTEGEKCANCGEIFVESTVVPATGHDWQKATCTEPKTCKACGATEGEALGHSYGAGWTADENAHWHTCTRCGDHGDEAAHTPDREAPNVGVPVLCSVCGRTLQKALEYSIYDANRDGEVNLLDVTHAQRFYGLSKGDDGWNPQADINGDGTVSIADLILILNHYFFQ